MPAIDIRDSVREQKQNQRAKHQHPMERIWFPLPLRCVCSYTHRGVSIGAKNHAESRHHQRQGSNNH